MRTARRYATVLILRDTGDWIGQDIAASTPVSAIIFCTPPNSSRSKSLLQGKSTASPRDANVDLFVLLRTSAGLCAVQSFDVARNCSKRDDLAS